MHRIVFIPFTGHPLSVNILWLTITKPAFSLAGNPVIKLFLVLLKTLVLFKLDNFFGYEVIGHCGFGDNVSAEQIVVFGKG